MVGMSIYIVVIYWLFCCWALLLSFECRGIEVGMCTLREL